MAVLAVLAVTGFGQSVQAVNQPPPGGAGPAAVAQARAESTALAAKSHLSTAELIKAARQAGSRLPVHTKPAAPPGIPVHAPIVVKRAPAAESSQPPAGGRGLALGAAVLPDVALLPHAASLPGTAALPSTVSPLTGEVTSPQDQGQTSTIFTLQGQLTGGCGSPCSATTYNGVTFQYRVGNSGSFTNIPASDASNGGGAVIWPVTTSVLSSGAGVTSPALTWLVTHTIPASGLLQIQAEFTDGLGDSYTTSPVTVTLDMTGSGGDFGTAEVGPVNVGLQSGNLSLSVTDVSVASYGAGLSVSRTFNSLAAGTSSLFGPGWTSSLPVPGTTMNWSSVTDDGSYAVLNSTDGSVLTFVAGTPSNDVTPYTAQGSAAAQALTLTKSPSGFTLSDPSGDQAQFTPANANTPGYYTPSQVTQPGTSRSVGYIYDATVGDANYGKVELMVAPNANLAPGVSSTTACPYPASAATWQGGCKGLQFTYGAATGHVSQIDLFYDQQGVLTDVPIANYSYDSSGRLAAQWDPRFSPNLVASYTYDENPSDANYGRLISFSPPQSAVGSLAPWVFSYDTTAGTTDYGKLTSASRTHSGTGGTATQTIDYEVPLTTAAGGPVNMDPTTVDTWNQTDVPASAVAIFPATHVPTSPPSASDWQYAQISTYDANGLEVNTASYGAGAWNITTTQYDGYGDVISRLSAGDRAEALAAGSSSASVAAELETVNTYTTAADGSQQLTHVYGPLHSASVLGDGIQEIRDHTHYVYDQGAPSTGAHYDLVTTQTDTASIGAGLNGTDMDARTTDNVYNNGTDNTGWTLRKPLQTIVGPLGLQITNTTVYNENASLYGGEPLMVQSCMPSDTSCSGAGTEQYIYYTGGTNPIDSACSNHAIWADLVCKTEPVAQPGIPGLPSLPVTVYTYNVYQQVLTKTETFGAATRTTTYTYNALRQLSTTTVTTSGSEMGASIQETQNLYSSATQQLTTQETLDASGNVTAKIKYGYDDFGQLTSYTDASGNPTGYIYDLGGRVTSRNDGKGTATLSYGSGFSSPTQIVDSQAGTFTAQYNPDGDLATQTYPGGLIATYGYNETGTATSLSYAGESWTSPLTDTISPNAHGDWVSQAITDTSKSLASSQAYTYDKADRLTTVQDTNAGQCATRTYTYNANSDRTSLAAAAPGSGGACQTTNPVTKNYTYDSADRLTNAGYTYDTQGDITATPEGDVGGVGTLTATYYANDMLASQTQNGQTETWQLDPTSGRPGSYTATGVSYVNHYSDTGNSPAWVSGSDGTWSRNITDSNGELAACVTVSGVTLELPNLHGDVMATAASASSATGPTNTYIYSEFGTAESGTPGAYGWEGANGISGNALGGQLLMGARAYNPSNGRFAQTDPIPGGSANAYDYALQNPLTNSDLTGQRVWRRCYGSPWFQYCVSFYDHYSSMRYIYMLETWVIAYTNCTDFFGRLPGQWAAAIAHFCRIRMLEYKYREGEAKFILSICGGTSDSTAGLIMLEADWRYGWWWFGWHWSRWHTLYSVLVGCWNI